MKTLLIFFTKQNKKNLPTLSISKTRVVVYIRFGSISITAFFVTFLGETMRLLVDSSLNEKSVKQNLSFTTTATTET